MLNWLFNGQPKHMTIFTKNMVKSPRGKRRQINNLGHNRLRIEFEQERMRGHHLEVAPTKIPSLKANSWAWTAKFTVTSFPNWIKILHSEFLNIPPQLEPHKNDSSTFTLIWLLIGDVQTHRRDPFLTVWEITIFTRHLIISITEGIPSSHSYKDKFIDIYA